MIANTAGWDTDCNSGNVGCLMGIKNGLAGIDAGPDWRGPMADRMFLPTADGGRAITDALRESYAVVNIGRALAGQAPAALKQGARFHFDLPGAVQGFRCEDSPEARGTVTVENVAGHGESSRRSLALRYRSIAAARVGRVATATFAPADALNLGGYGGAGMVIQGERPWADYTVTVAVRPHMAGAVGLAVNVRGLFRYVALILGADGTARLVERHDSDETVLAETLLHWELDRTYRLTFGSRRGGAITARIDDRPVLEATVARDRAAGAVGLWVREGHCLFGMVAVAPGDE
jgi:hypothetical protein